MDVIVGLYKESWALKNWCFWPVVFENTCKSPLDYKEIKPVNPKGNQSWIFIERTDAEAEALVFWPPDAKSWFIGKDPDAGKDWRQEEKGTTEDKMGRMASLTRCTWVWASSGSWWWTGNPGILQSMGLQRVTDDWVTEMNWTELNWRFKGMWNKRTSGEYSCEDLRKTINEAELK